VIPILAVVGRSGSGKTTLLEKLIRELTTRGRRVGTIKHHAHGPVTVDSPGKDSWRHRQAGACAVALDSSDLFFVVRDRPEGLTPEAIAHLALFGMDVILVEGFTDRPIPKIEINRRAQAAPLLCGPADCLVAIVADWPTGASVPQFGPEEIAPLADFIEREYLQASPPPPLELLVGGRRIALDPETATELSRAVRRILGDRGHPSAGPTIELRIPGTMP
jgi:molybdopterin-guanine dinucleotide biosynthesis protein B